MLRLKSAAVKPVVYPPDAVMEEVGVKCTLVEGITENEMGLAAIHNLFTVGIQAIPIKDLNLQALDAKPDCFTASKGLKDNQVRMFYKEKGLEDDEKNMVVPVMSFFKHMHTLSNQSSEVKKLIGDICEVWSVWTGWQTEPEFNENDKGTKYSVMHWLNLKKYVIMGYQFRPYLSVRSNGKVFLSTSIGCQGFDNYML